MVDTCWNCGDFTPSAAFCSNTAPGGVVHRTNLCRRTYARVKDPATYHCTSWYPKTFNKDMKVAPKKKEARMRLF